MRSIRRRSPAALRDYLASFDAGGQVEAFFGEPRIAGKYYYNDELKGFNFERRRMKFSQALATIVASLDQPGSESVYVGSVPANDYLPGFAASNPMPADTRIPAATDLLMARQKISH